MANGIENVLSQDEYLAGITREQALIDAERREKEMEILKKVPGLHEAVAGWKMQPWITDYAAIIKKSEETGIPAEQLWKEREAELYRQFPEMVAPHPRQSKEYEDKRFWGGTAKMFTDPTFGALGPAFKTAMGAKTLAGKGTGLFSVGAGTGAGYTGLEATAKGEDLDPMDVAAAAAIGGGLTVALPVLLGGGIKLTKVGVEKLNQLRNKTNRSMVEETQLQKLQTIYAKQPTKAIIKSASPHQGFQKQGFQKGNIMGSPEALASRKFYQSDKFKKTLQETFEELSIYDNSGNLISRPSQKSVLNKLNIEDTKVQSVKSLKNTLEELNLSFNPSYNIIVEAQKIANKNNKLLYTGFAENRQIVFPTDGKIKLQFLKDLKDNLFTSTQGKVGLQQRDIAKKYFGASQLRTKSQIKNASDSITGYLKNTTLTDDLAKKLKIDSQYIGKKLNEVPDFQYQRPSNLESLSSIERREAISAWKKVAPKWQKDLWNDVEKLISGNNAMFPNDRSKWKALDHITPFINSVNKLKAQHPRNWQIMNLNDNNVLKKALFEGVESQLSAMNTKLSSLKKGSNEYKTLQKEMQEVFDTTLQNLTDKSYFVNTRNKFVPPKFRVDTTKNPIDVLKHNLSEMRVEQFLSAPFDVQRKGINKGGRVGFKSGGTEFDALVEMYMKDHGMERKDAVTEALRDLGKLKQGGRVGYKKGGQVKLNTADYIEEYGDGTELIHYKSSLRAITKQLD